MRLSLRFSLCLLHAVGARLPHPHAHIQSRRSERAKVIADLDIKAPAGRQVYSKR